MKSVLQGELNSFTFQSKIKKKYFFLIGQFTYQIDLFGPIYERFIQFSWSRIKAIPAFFIITVWKDVRNWSLKNTKFGWFVSVFILLFSLKLLIVINIFGCCFYYKLNSAIYTNEMCARERKLMTLCMCDNLLF